MLPSTSCGQGQRSIRLRQRTLVGLFGDIRKNLSRPLTDIKKGSGHSPEYHNLLRMGLVDSIDGLQYTRMSMVPDPEYKPLPFTKLMAARP
jgi:hypothetical protein